MQQVSFVVRHRVRKDALESYENWLREITVEAAKFPGHLGVQVVRPPFGGNEYVSVVRFASDADATRWSKSHVREQLISRIATCLDGGDSTEIHSGIDYWFTPELPSQKQPVRWKQWIVTTSVIWPLTMIVPHLYLPVFSKVPVLGTFGISHGIIAGTIVALVIYLIMPRYVRLLSSWLFR